MPKRMLLVVVLCVAVLAIGFFIWPTPYRFVQANGAFLRIERWSGTSQVLDPDRGWIPVPVDTVPYRPNPFDDLPDLPDTTVSTTGGARGALSPNP